jgi:hypothetical protein
MIPVTLLHQTLVKLQTEFRVNQLQWLAAMVPIVEIKSKDDVTFTLLKIHSLHKLLVLHPPGLAQYRKLQPLLASVRDLVSEVAEAF